MCELNAIQTIDYTKNYIALKAVNLQTKKLIPCRNYCKQRVTEQ